MITEKDLETIRTKLENKAAYKRDIALAKAQKEIDAINRECEAYWDGVYAALRAVAELVPPEQESK